MEPNKIICDALRNWQQIEFIYHGKYRKGNPQCYGLSKTGKPVLRVHLVEGGGQPEQLFTVDKMTGFNVLSTTFDSPGPNYKPGDADIPHIFCDLEEESVTADVEDNPPGDFDPDPKSPI